MYESWMLSLRGESQCDGGIPIDRGSDRPMSDGSNFYASNAIIIGLSDPRSKGPSVYRTLGLKDPRSIGPSVYRAVTQCDRQTVELGWPSGHLFCWPPCFHCLPNLQCAWIEGGGGALTPHHGRYMYVSIALLQSQK